jgi:hypothetical protein
VAGFSSAVTIIGEVAWQNTFFLNHEIRHVKLHTYEEALSLFSICRSVLAFAKRGFNFFSVRGFSWKKTAFIRRCCIKVNKINYSGIYFTYGFCDGDVQASFEKYRRLFPSR